MAVITAERTNFLRTVSTANNILLSLIASAKLAIDFSFCVRQTLKLRLNQNQEKKFTHLISTYVSLETSLIALAIFVSKVILSRKHY